MDPDRLPGEMLGSTRQRPGQLRIWPTAGGGNSLITVQAQMFEPVAAQPPSASRAPPPPPPPRVVQVYVTLDRRIGQGLTARAALLVGAQIVSDTTLAFGGVRG